MSDLVQYKVSQCEECDIKQNLYWEIAVCVCLCVTSQLTNDIQNLSKRMPDPNARLTNLMYVVSGFILLIHGVIMMVGLVHT